jgi:hypothetical protein
MRPVGGLSASFISGAGISSASIPTSMGAISKLLVVRHFWLWKLVGPVS